MNRWCTVLALSLCCIGHGVWSQDVTDKTPEYQMYQGDAPADGPTTVLPASATISASFQFGIVTHWASGTQLDWASEMNARWVRTGVGWEWVEPDYTEPPTYHWDVADRIVADCKARGLKILWGLPYTPVWASSNGKDNGYPKDDVAREHWRKFVRATVERYRNDIDYFEVWNEPNNSRFWQGTTDQWIDYILIPAWEEIKAVDPEKKVVGPTLETIRGARISVRDFFSRLGQRGAAQYFDVVSQNVYEDKPETVIEQFEKGDYECWWIFCLKKRPALFKIYRWNGFDAKPVWLTEFGWCSNEVGETRQSNRIIDTLERIARRPRFGNAFIYELKDDERIKDKWGTMHSDGTPKPIYWKLHDLFSVSSTQSLKGDDSIDFDGEKTILNSPQPDQKNIIYLVPKDEENPQK